MPLFNTSNPFKSSSSSSTSSSTQSSNRRKGPSSSSSSNNSSRRPQQPPRPPPDPRLVSLSQLDSLTSRLTELKSSFIQPSQLHFNPKSSTGEQPKLEYDKNNAPFHAYDEALTKFLIELDGIDSCGEDEIRQRRKQLVLDVEKELERLDQVRKEEYKKQQAGGKFEAGQRVEREKEQTSESSTSVASSSQARQPPNSVNSQLESRTNSSQPAFPPGLALPPRDYPASNGDKQQSPQDYTSQYRNGLAASTKRPSSSESPQRPPQAHRGPPPTSSAWNSNNPYRQTAPPPYDARYAPQPQPQTGARYTNDDPYAAQGRGDQQQRSH